MVAPILADAARGAHLAALLRTRLDELLRSMNGTVLAFRNARWNARAGEATWTPEIVTSGALLRLAQDALARDGALRAA
jgi:hypothetical protein